MRLIRLKAIFIFLFFVFLGCETSDKKVNKNVLHSDLKSHPERYHNSEVKLHGYIRIGFEDNFMFKNEEDFIEKSYNKAIWVNVRKSTAKNLLHYNGKVVRVVGDFDKDGTGVNFVDGSISIKKISLIRDE